MLTIFATRHAVGGFDERVTLIDVDGGFLAVTEYVPSERNGHDIVVCSSIMADFLHNLRREVVLSRWLATRGSHVIRFHYLGTGNSAGSDDVATLDQMTADACAVADQLIDDTNGGRTTWIGTRLGAFPAVRAAAKRGDGRVALIDPVLTGKAYLHEGFRARMATNAKDGAESITSGELSRIVEETGEVDILGHTLTLPMYEQLQTADLAEFIDRPSSVLLAQLGGDQLKKGLAKLNASLEGAGVDTTTMVMDDTLGWWFAESEALPDDDIIARLGGWLLSDNAGDGTGASS